jgi:hypothetical protein
MKCEGRGIRVFPNRDRKIAEKVNLDTTKVKRRYYWRIL